MSVASARAKVVKEWEIVEQLGDDKYKNSKRNFI
jgi:hypothetical protein